MPTEKRARKRAQREAKVAALERQRRRRTSVRRTVTILVLVAVAVGVYVAVSAGGKKKTPTASKTTTTTTTTTTLPPNAVSTTTTVSLAGDTTSANCPASFSTSLKKPSWSSPPPTIIDPTRTYSATVTTDVGSFTIALDTASAPKTVNNFVFLAENHFYDCVEFHRVIPGFMDQSGDPTGTGTGGPGYQFADENIPSNGYTAGEVAMANSGKNTNGSQFFVLVSSYQTDSYSLFGHVTSGLSVVKKINSDGSSSGTPTVRHRIVSVVISES